MTGQPSALDFFLAGVNDVLDNSREVEGFVSVDTGLPSAEGEEPKVRCSPGQGLMGGSSRT